ncbi:HD domain-containing protein [Desulfothermus sp.]
MATIRKSLLQLIFSGSFMRRWNDKLRPFELWEVDKQAHKMIIAWVLFCLNSRDLSPDDRRELALEVIQGGIFEYLYRLIITDIKPPIFYKIKSNPVHYKQLTDWVFENLEPKLRPIGEDFWNKFRSYFLEEQNSLAREILLSAHLCASQWEFNLLKGLNKWDEEIDEIDKNFVNNLKRFDHIKGVPAIIESNPSPLKKFIFQCGQLRFQKRWSQTPRIPETSVLGHMFIVACYAYFFTVSMGGCKSMAINNFFSGLFHDLPELLTRDIISPVKRSVRKIGDFIKEYETTELERRIFKVLEMGGYRFIAEELRYLLGIDVGSEFISVIRINNETKEVTWQMLYEKYNYDQYEPKDGETLKVCDNIAAFIEAYTALKNGITSDHLQQAVWRIRNDFNQYSLGNRLHVGSLLADFD